MPKKNNPPLLSDREIRELKLKHYPDRADVDAGIRFHFGVGLEYAREIYEAERSELLEAVKAALSFIEDDGTQGSSKWTRDMLRATISKSEGARTHA